MVRMLVKLNKDFKKAIVSKSFKGKASLIDYDLNGTFRVIQENYTGEGIILVRSNYETIYNAMIVLPGHYEIVTQDVAK